MKLSTKLLTILPSVAIVGASIPAITSCSCSKDQYLFNYGDHVNCRDKKDENYHKPDEVRKAAKVRAPKAQKASYRESEIGPIIQSLPDKGQQLYFSDFIASIVILQNDTINLKDWNAELDRVGTYVYSFNWNGVAYPKKETEPASTFSYDYDRKNPSDKTIYLYYRCDIEDPNEIKLKSYVFSDCLWDI